MIPFPFFGRLMGRYTDDELGNLKRLVEAGESLSTFQNDISPSGCDGRSETRTQREPS